jgi:hypothetical protein
MNLGTQPDGKFDNGTNPTYNSTVEHVRKGVNPTNIFMTSRTNSFYFPDRHFDNIPDFHNNKKLDHWERLPRALF